MTNGEAAKYISEAAYFSSHHHFSAPKYLFYSVSVFLNLLSQQAGAGVTGVYVVQLFTGLYALLCFHRLSLVLTRSRSAAWLASLLLLACFPWQSWISHLYSEAMFLNLLLIFSYYLFRSGRPRFAPWQVWISGVLLILSRPTGLLLIPVIAILVAHQLYEKRRWVILILSGLASFMAFLWVLNYAMRGEGEFDFLKPFLEEHIICGVPTLPVSAGQSSPASTHGLGDLLLYIGAHPAQVIRLAANRFLAFFGLTRSYYSTGHNLFLIAFFYPLYLASAYGMYRCRKMNRPFLLYGAGSIALFCCSVLITCDDWLNRFIMPIIPLIILFSAIGFSVILKKSAKDPG